jgi:hypothetical protein
MGDALWLCYAFVAFYCLGTLRAGDWPDKRWGTFAISLIASLSWPMVFVLDGWKFARNFFLAARAAGGEG